MENDAARDPRYPTFMLSEWLQEALNGAKMKQTELARELTARLGRSIDRAAVNKMLSGGRAISGDEMIEIEKITGHEAPREIEVQLLGRVGAGQAVHIFDDSEAPEPVPAPPRARPGTVAVEVDGESMFPAYENGTLLYYSRLLPPADMVNRRCVIKLSDGRMYVKVLRKGSNDKLWTLQSVNTLYPDMVDEVVEWAAPIDWTKPR